MIVGIKTKRKGRRRIPPAHGIVFLDALVFAHEAMATISDSENLITNDVGAGSYNAFKHDD